LDLDLDVSKLGVRENPEEVVAGLTARRTSLSPFAIAWSPDEPPPAITAPFTAIGCDLHAAGDANVDRAVEAPSFLTFMGLNFAEVGGAGEPVWFHKEAETLAGFGDPDSADKSERSGTWDTG